MPEKGWEDLPDHDVGDAPNRFDVDGFLSALITSFIVAITGSVVSWLL